MLMRQTLKYNQTLSSRYIVPVDCATSALSSPASLDELQDPCKLVPIFLDCGF